MIRVLTPADVAANQELILAYPAFRRSPTTVADVARFREAGALLTIVLAEEIDDREMVPGWALPFAPASGPALVPRAMLLCQFLGPDGWRAFRDGAQDAQLTPLRADDAEAFMFLTIVNSTVRNGMARLVIALSEQLAAHPHYDRLAQIVWYTRTVKGQAMNEYFHGQPTGDFVTRQRPDEPLQRMPVYAMPRAQWQALSATLIEKLLGFEDSFTEDLAAVHQALRGRVADYVAQD